jgi:hypothetical protein
MNGFNPLGELKDWHIKLCFAFCVVGAIDLIVEIVKDIIWFHSHL